MREDEESLRVQKLKASLAKAEEEVASVNDILRRTTKGMKHSYLLNSVTETGFWLSHTVLLEAG